MNGFPCLFPDRVNLTKRLIPFQPGGKAASSPYSSQRLVTQSPLPCSVCSEVEIGLPKAVPKATASHSLTRFRFTCDRKSQPVARIRSNVFLGVQRVHGEYLALQPQLAEEFPQGVRFTLFTVLEGLHTVDQPAFRPEGAHHRDEVLEARMAILARGTYRLAVQRDPVILAGGVTLDPIDELGYQEVVVKSHQHGTEGEVAGNTMLEAKGLYQFLLVGCGEALEAPEALVTTQYPHDDYREDIS